jgi:hypothetical protein
VASASSSPSKVAANGFDVVVAAEAFSERVSMLDTKVGASDGKDDPADVARDGFEALMAGKERVVASSLSTKRQGRASRFMPDSAKAAPGSGKQQ